MEEGRNHSQNSRDKISREDLVRNSFERTRHRDALRRLSHSPVDVNRNYELSEENTSKLWSHFEEQMKRGQVDPEFQKTLSRENLKQKQRLKGLRSGAVTPLRQKSPGFLKTEAEQVPLYEQIKQRAQNHKAQTMNLQQMVYEQKRLLSTQLEAQNPFLSQTGVLEHSAAKHRLYHGAQMHQLLSRPDIRPQHIPEEHTFETVKRIEAPTILGPVETDYQDAKFRDPAYNEFLRSTGKLERRVLTTLQSEQKRRDTVESLTHEGRSPQLSLNKQRESRITQGSIHKKSTQGSASKTKGSILNTHARSNHVDTKQYLESNGLPIRDDELYRTNHQLNASRLLEQYVSQAKLEKEEPFQVASLQSSQMNKTTSRFNTEHVTKMAPKASYSPLGFHQNVEEIGEDTTQICSQNNTFYRQERKQEHLPEHEFYSSVQRMPVMSPSGSFMRDAYDLSSTMFSPHNVSLKRSGFVTNSTTNPLFRQAKLGPKSILTAYPSNYISGSKKSPHQNSRPGSRLASPSFTPKEQDCRRIVMGMVNTMRQKSPTPESSHLGSTYSMVLKENTNFQNKTANQSQMIDLNFITSPTSALKSSKCLSQSQKIMQLHKQVKQILDKKQYTQEQYQLAVTKLLTIDKQLSALPKLDAELQFYRLYNYYLLLLVHHSFGDLVRASRLLDSKSQLSKMMEEFKKKSRMKKEQFTFLLRILELAGKVHIQKEEFAKCRITLQSLLQVYKKQRNISTIWGDSQYKEHEFTKDDYVQAKASFAECHMAMGHFEDAIKQFESCKRQIQQELIFENHHLYVNICIQLGSCYCSANEPQSALENYEQALFLIQRNNLEVNPKLQSQVTQEIALLYQAKGYLGDSMRMFEKTLDINKKTYPEYNDKVLESYLDLARSKVHLKDFSGAIVQLLKAQEIAKLLTGGLDLVTIRIGKEIAEVQFLDQQFANSIQNFETAQVGYKRLKDPSLETELNSCQIQLIDLYLLVGKHTEAHRIVEEVQLSAHNQKNENGFRVLNQLANLVRKYELYAQALEFYKLTLLMIKKFHKDEYKSQIETCKVLINMASTEFLRTFYQESLTYYDQALQIASKNNDLRVTEVPKIQISIANVLNKMGDFQKAHIFFCKAISEIESSLPERKDKEDAIRLLMEARENDENLRKRFLL